MNPSKSAVVICDVELMQKNITHYLERRNSIPSSSPPRENNPTLKRLRSSPEIVSGREKKANIMNDNDTLFERFKRLLDDKIDNLPTKLNIEEKIKDLATKDDISKAVSEMSSENEILRKQINSLKEAAEKRDRRIEMLELEARKNNLILRGLRFAKSDDLVTVAEILLLKF